MNNHVHLDFDGWRRLIDELLGGRIRRWLEVLSCRTCRSRLRRLLSLNEPKREPLRSSPSAWSSYRAELRRAAEDSTRAHQVLDKFLEANDLQRSFWLRNGSLRGNLFLCQQILKRADDQVGDSPATTLNLTSLAQDLTQWVDGEPEHRARLWTDCMASAWRIRGRVHLRLGSLQEAQAALDRGERYQQNGSGDPLERAALLKVRASVLREQGRLVEATRVVRVALSTYRDIGDLTGVAACRLGIAHFKTLAERPAPALWDLDNIQRSIDLDPRQRLTLVHNKIAALCFLHGFQSAARLLDSWRDLYTQYTDSEIQIRRLWVQGKVAIGLERLDKGRDRFEESRRLILDRWGDYDASLLALEFGQLYLELGHSREAKRLLEQAIPILEARSLPQISKAEELLETARQDARS